MATTDRLLIQVVSQLKPQRCGVSDHAILLAEELQSVFQIKTVFIVLNSKEPCDLSFQKIYCQPFQLVDACISCTQGDPGALLLHYSGYGFSIDGAPSFLAQALRDVRSTGQFRIGVYFHELFATGMPWTSAFWQTNRQKQVARRIAGESDLVATNLSFHARWLRQEAIRNAGTPLLQLPVFSNVGESLEIPTLRDRRPDMVVFGLPGTRRKSYDILSRLGRMLEDLGIEKVIDVGLECGAPSHIGGIAVNRMGVLDADDLATLLSQLMFGFVPHPAFCLAKSGIFAGLCAHGTIPVLPESFPREMDGLIDGTHLLSPVTARAAKASGFGANAVAAWRWYSEHRVQAHAAAYERLLFQPAHKAGTAFAAAAANAGL